MTKLRNIVFIILAISTTLAVAGSQAYNLATGTERATHSYLEGRAYQTAPEINLETISSGTYQKQVDKYLADHVPHRDGVLIYNAEFQRTAITVANAPFGFEAIPTFYDSSALWCEDLDALFDAPLLKRNYSESTVQSSVEAWSSIIESHPDTNWCFALVDRTSTTAASPLANLVEDPADYAYFYEMLEAGLPDSCSLPNLSYDDTNSFLADYYKTDHHWQIQGAARAYTKIADSFGIEPVNLSNTFIAFKGPFYGSAARHGLLSAASDIVYDAAYEPSDFTVTADGKAQNRSAVDESFAAGFSGFSKQRKFENVYSTYYHGDWALLEYDNPTAPNGTLLIIGDSYTNCIDHVFAESYQHVRVIDPRYYKESIATYVSKLNPDDAVIILGANNIVEKKVLEKLQ